MRGETETISLVASPTQTVAEDLGEDGIIDLTRALSSTAAPSRTLTPALEDPACLRRPVDLELSSTPAFSATLDAETPRPQSPIPKQKPSSDAQAESSRTAQPATPPRNSDVANGSSAQTPLITASRKRRAEDDENDEPVAVKKEEENSRSNEISLTPHHNRAGRAIKFEIEVDEDGDNSSDDDVIEISPFKRLKGRQDIRSYFETGPFRRRQRSESPSPLPPPEPFYHPDFPERPPLRYATRLLLYSGPPLPLFSLRTNVSWLLRTINEYLYPLTCPKPLTPGSVVSK